MFAQGYYPLQVGNTWQYRDSYDSTYGWTDKIIKDTVLSNGYTYAVIINESLTNGYIRQEGSKVYYYNRYFMGDSGYQYKEELYYDFSKTTGDTVRTTIDTIAGDTITIQVIDDVMMTVFWKVRRVWTYYETSRRNSVYVLRQVADSVGLIYTGGEAGVAYSLRGAIINGKNCGTITDVEQAPHLVPNQCKLYQNYPNPFNPATNIKYQLPTKSYTILKVYDILGRELQTLVNGIESAGGHIVLFNASRLATGIYIYELRTGEQVLRKRMILIK